MKDNELSIPKIQNELDLVLQDKATAQALITTTFKGLTEPVMKQAMLEGMLRGFKLKDFLDKNVYAIPYGEKYSLVTSIDNARKIGVRAGLVGKGEPIYETDEKGALISCAITVKRKLPNDDTIGEFSSKVYFAEYFDPSKPIWKNKPRTMLAKVAEMHALRMACPEELSQFYTSEEFDKPETPVVQQELIDFDRHKARLEACLTVEDLAATWAQIPGEAKKHLEPIKNELKAKLSGAK